MRDSLRSLLGCTEASMARQCRSSRDMAAAKPSHTKPADREHTCLSAQAEGRPGFVTLYVALKGQI